MRRLSAGQATILNVLVHEPLSTRQIVNKLNLTTFNHYWSPDQIHSSLIRMEHRGFVRRTEGFPRKWELTPTGRDHCEA